MDDSKSDQDLLNNLIYTKVQEIINDQMKIVHNEISKLKSDISTLFNKIDIDRGKFISLPLSPEKYNFNSRIKHKESLQNKPSNFVKDFASRNKRLLLQRTDNFSMNKEIENSIFLKPKAANHISWAYFSLQDSESSEDQTDLTDENSTVSNIKLPVFNSKSSTRNCSYHKSPKNSSVVFKAKQKYFLYNHF